ncbi:helix-turn-helix domain-containing protein [Dinghuibacter silviterrae]|uniref:AraC-like DNA-binding protein n=1 Tax=Dinghuibacter silviterrae TaxID=1539049 RepID=A0A4R8DW56_9BACT|nr:helix-turn-helix domain-containing protein [Dinghuibacter silviterrae]TDX01637.1 AraC-like DNA-binding protein [Dinghuibacter silviterrae]
MKVKDIPRYSLKDWAPGAGSFAVSTLEAMGEAQGQRWAGPHRDDFYGILWITAGEARVTIDAVAYTASAHALIFVAPGQVVQMSGNLAGWWIAFEEQFYCVRDEAANRSRGINSHLFFNPDFATVLSPDEADEAVLGNIVSMMEEEYRGRGDHYLEAFFSLLQLFLIRVTRIMEREEREPEHAGGPFLQFRQLIEQHYKDKKNVSDYARMMNMTPVCLNALSKSLSGLTAGEQIRGHVTAEAKRLLFNTDLSAKEIAYRLGFEDAPYFSRFFKKYTGQTLLEFREQSRLNAV